MTTDEAEKRIRAYIRPAGKDIAVFAVSSLILAAVIIILSTVVIVSSPEDILNKTFVLIDSETGHAEIGGGYPGNCRRSHFRTGMLGSGFQMGMRGEGCFQC